MISRPLLDRGAGKLVCEVRGDSLLLAPEHPAAELPRLVQDPKSGLRITQSPAGTQVTNQDVRAALLDFPGPDRSADILVGLAFSSSKADKKVGAPPSREIPFMHTRCPSGACLFFSCLALEGGFIIGVGAMKHSPFESSYLQDFVILEERHGSFTRFPRSEQLPLLARALKAEFEGMTITEETRPKAWPRFD